MNSMWTVMRFTLLNRFRSKAFLVSSIIFALVITVGINLPGIISGFSSDKAAQVGMMETNRAFADQLEAYYTKQEKPAIHIVLLPDQGSAEANDKMIADKIKSKDLKGFLDLKEDKAAGFPAFTYKSQSSFMESGVREKLQPALFEIKQQQAVKEAGLTQQQLTKLLAPVVVDSVMVKDGADKSESQYIVAYILVYALLVLTFMAVTMYGNLIATEITSEKSSRIMEILIATVSPVKQMFGKVLGMFLLGVMQIAFFVILAIININLPNNQSYFESMNLNFGDVPVSLYVYFVIFYLLGFFLFAMLFAAVGSIVSRTEDLGQAVLPITMLAIGGFYIGIFGINAPTGSFITTMSFIPFFSPGVMFLRIGMASPETWEILLSLAILVVTILIVGWLAARIYRTGVLMYGKKPSWKEVSKAMKAYKA